MKHDMSQRIEEEIILYFQSVQVLHMKMHVHCVCVNALTLNKISEEYRKLAKRLANTHTPFHVTFTSSTQFVHIAGVWS